MRVVIHDFTPIANSLISHFIMMNHMCMTHEDVIDWLISNRYRQVYGSSVDHLCDLKMVDMHDRTYVHKAASIIQPVIDEYFPMSQGIWRCCGFVDNVGYFLLVDEQEADMIPQFHQAVKQSICALRGFYDSNITNSGA